MELIKVDPSELDGREAEVELLSQAEAIVCLPYGGVVVDDELVAQRRPKRRTGRSRSSSSPCC